MITGKKARKAVRENFVRAKNRASLSTGDILRILREKNELSQGRLAKLAGLTQATVSSIENDRISLGVERARALAKVLHIHPAVLLFPDWQDEAA